MKQLAANLGIWGVKRAAEGLQRAPAGAAGPGWAIRWKKSSTTTFTSHLEPHLCLEKGGCLGLGFLIQDSQGGGSTDDSGLRE